MTEARVMPPAEFSALLRADADRAVADGVGNRRPCPCLPADATDDHRVAYALYDLKCAAKAAFELGATQGEVEATCDAGRRSAK